MRDYEETDKTKALKIVNALLGRKEAGYNFPEPIMATIKLKPTVNGYTDECNAIPLSCGPYYQYAPVFICKYGGWVVLLDFASANNKYRAKLLMSV